MAVGGVGLGAAGGGPTMQVLPSPIGVKYSQTVEVKAQNLPKGSGSIAVTICGLNDASGKTIASPTADDCAGANDLSSGLVKLQQWKDGTFDQQYTLPESGQKFGKNQRFCDAKHLLRARGRRREPEQPRVLHRRREFQFIDQKPADHDHDQATKKPTPTTKPGDEAEADAPPAPAPTTDRRRTTTTTAPLVAVNAGGGAHRGPERWQRFGERRRSR